MRKRRLYYLDNTINCRRIHRKANYGRDKNALLHQSRIQSEIRNKEQDQWQDRVRAGECIPLSPYR